MRIAGDVSEHGEHTHHEVKVQKTTDLGQEVARMTSTDRSAPETK